MTGFLNCESLLPVVLDFANASRARPLISGMAHQWTIQINAKLPSLWDVPESKLQPMVEEHFTNVMEIINAHESVLTPYLKETKGAVIGVKDVISSKVKLAMASFQREADSLTSAIESIRESMESTFEKCKEISGKSHGSPTLTAANKEIGTGSYAMRRNLLEGAVDKGANSYFQKA